MLTPSQYQAIGMLALGFNEIEFLFESYTAALLEARKLRVALVVSEEGTFHQKAERLKRILGAVQKEYPSFEYLVETLLQTVVRARELAQLRNEYVHALVIEDFANNQTKLRIRRGQPAPCDEETIRRAAAEVSVLVGRIHDQCADLQIALARTRRSELTGKRLLSTDDSAAE